MTPLPGVSAPAGLRPSPLAPLFAAAQLSLCPVSADKAGQYNLRQADISKYHLDLESTGTVLLLAPVNCDPTAGKSGKHFFIMATSNPVLSSPAAGSVH